MSYVEPPSEEPFLALGRGSQSARAVSGGPCNGGFRPARTRHRQLRFLAPSSHILRPQFPRIPFFESVSAVHLEGARWSRVRRQVNRALEEE